MPMRIETLIITGANNHDWVRSAPRCRELLEETGRFKVTVTENPSELLSDSRAASAFDLFFVDYNGPAWDEDAKRNFVEAVRGGTGVCILHAADNAFDGWKEYEEICALCWREGTSHGSYHTFDIQVTNPAHPITRGLPTVFKDHPDELYHRLVHMHNTPFEAIATAYSSPDSGGTGQDEPALVVKTYGKGRVFHCILGHVWEGGVMDTFENPDFQQLLQRGCEWAATGAAHGAALHGSLNEV